jgi:hypothetical protein
MQKLWLTFAQLVAAAAILLAALLALDRLFPGLLPRNGSDVTIHEVAHEGSAHAVSTYADAARKSLPSVGTSTPPKRSGPSATLSWTTHSSAVFSVQGRTAGHSACPV